MGVAILPFEADPPLVINPDTVLPKAIAHQGFEMIARYGGQIRQRSGGVQVIELPLRNIR
jgi:hypothetical protein